MDRLETTNAILAILAATSAVQTVVLVGLAYGAYKAYTSMTALIETKLTPSLLRLESLVANLEHTATVVRTRADDVHHAIGSAKQAAAELGMVMWPRAAIVASVAGGVLGAVRTWRSARRAGRKVNVVAG